MNKIKLIIPLLLVTPSLFGCGKAEPTGNFRYKEEYKVTYTAGGANLFEKFDDGHFFTSEANFVSAVVEALYTPLGGVATQDHIEFTPTNTTHPVVNENEASVSDYGFVNKVVIEGQEEPIVTCHYGKVNDKYHLYDEYVTPVSSVITVYEHTICYGMDPHSKIDAHGYYVYDNELVFGKNSLNIFCDFDFIAFVSDTKKSIIKGTLNLSYSRI